MASSRGKPLTKEVLKQVATEIEAALHGGQQAPKRIEKIESVIERSLGWKALAIPYN